MKTKICSKCKIEKSFSDFYKGSDKNGLYCWCKSCYKQYRKDNTSQIAKRQKQYNKDNVQQIVKQHKQYYNDNVLHILEQKKQYYEDNLLRIIERQKKYNKDNMLQRTKYYKQYNKDNSLRKTEQIKQWCKDSALFGIYSKKLEIFEEVRHCPENYELLEVKCAYCGRWIKPTNRQVSARLRTFNGTAAGESRFYCSENCKQACPIYRKIKYPKGFKQATSREVVPLLRQLVLKRDNYTCQKCGATTKTVQLHVHHILSYKLNTMLANDPDSCITLCKKCHKEVHSQEGCRYIDLQCQKGRN